MTSAYRIMRLAPLALLALGAVSCGLDKQSAPPLAGPSEFGQSITLTATPDTLIQDGQSTATIQAVVRDVNGRPVSGLQLMFSGESTQPARIPAPHFTAASVATNTNGVAVTQMIAPELPPRAPAPNPFADPIITVYVTPVGGSFANQATRTVDVRIVPPSETPRDNPPASGDGPYAVIVTSRNPVFLGESITFDASFSTYGGLACGTHCDYIWQLSGPGLDDNDGLPFRAVKFDREFDTPGDFFATLTVTDEHGRSDDETVRVTVLPAASSTNKVTQ